MTVNYVELNRIGYGSNFNKIYIDSNNNIIKKQCINSYGLNKISNEIMFYKHLLNNNINFPIPKILSFSNDSYEMEYLYNYECLYKLYKYLDYTNKQNILNKIYKSLKILHSFTEKEVSKDKYLKDLYNEIDIKILDRYKIVKPILEKYNFIKTVNNVKIIPFFETIKLIKNEIDEIIDKKNNFYYCIIHGDCQFNNILYNNKTENIVFIDPRGYYGEDKIYGIPEYDKAKVLFALTGYDEFDNRNIDNLDINNDNITINIDILHENFLKEDKFVILLMLSIWFGNSHCFIKNENKTVYSFFIASYLSSLYFEK